MKNKNVVCFFSLLFSLNLFAIDPIRPYPQNPKYFKFRGKPTLLITSAEHYGAVINPDFDFATYLATLKKYNFNYTRIFPGGSYLEYDAFGIKKNTLNPDSGRALLPWARSTTAGFRDGGNKFDLDNWNPAFFVRLKAFLEEASKQGIVVEITLFSSFYTDDQWKGSPLYHKNNINKIDSLPRERTQTIYNGNPAVYQEKYVRKIVHGIESGLIISLSGCIEIKSTEFKRQKAPIKTCHTSWKLSISIYQSSQWKNLSDTANYSQRRRVGGSLHACI